MSDVGNEAIEHLIKIIGDNEAHVTIRDYGGLSTCHEIKVDGGWDTYNFSVEDQHWMMIGDDLYEGSWTSMPSRQKRVISSARVSWIFAIPYKKACTIHRKDIDSELWDHMIDVMTMETL